MSTNEIKFLKKGVVFRYLKLAHFNMRTDELMQKEHFIRLGDYSKARPRSEDSGGGYETNRTKNNKDKDEQEKSTPSIRLADARSTTGMTFSSEVKNLKVRK